MDTPPNDPPSEPPKASGSAPDWWSDPWPMTLYAFGPYRAEHKEPKATPEQHVIGALYRTLASETFMLPSPHKWPDPDGVFGLLHPYVALSSFQYDFVRVARSKTESVSDRTLAAIGSATAFVLRQVYDLEELAWKARIASLEWNSAEGRLRHGPGLDERLKSPEEVEATLPVLRRTEDRLLHEDRPLAAER